MTYYPTPAINQALGLEPAASLDDALTAITQLRASLVDVAELREAVHRLKSERDAARQGVMVHRDRINELSAELKAANEELDYLKQTARVLLELTSDAPTVDIANAIKGEAESAARWAEEATTHRATIADLRTALAEAAAIRRRIEADVRATEQARDAAFAALHHATAAYL